MRAGSAAVNGPIWHSSEGQASKGFVRKSAGTVEWNVHRILYGKRVIKWLLSGNQELEPAGVREAELAGGGSRRRWRPEVAKCTPGARRTCLAGERTGSLVRIFLKPSERAKRAGALRHGFMMGHIKSEGRRGPRPGLGIALGPPAWRPIKPFGRSSRGFLGPETGIVLPSKAEEPVIGRLSGLETDLPGVRALSCGPTIVPRPKKKPLQSN
jgi:hypothetical protein